jgi:hypothetical protein
MRPSVRSPLRLVTCVVPAVALFFGATSNALGGEIARSGDETLRLGIAMTPHGAPADRGIRLRVMIERGTVSGNPALTALRSVVLKGPLGFRINSRNSPRCLVSEFFRSSGRCPRRSSVGTGTIILDLRPAVAQPFAVATQLFNATNDVNAANQPRSRPLPGLFIVAGLFGVSLDIRRPPTLLTEIRRPRADIVGRPIRYSRVDVSLGGSSRRGVPYLQRAASCPRNGRWRFRTTWRYWDGPTLTATHDVRCPRVARREAVAFAGGA